jgi:hypothetical protein
LLLGDAWSVVIEGAITGPSSPWSFTFSIATPAVDLQLNTSNNIALAPGVYRTYSLNLTTANSTQDVTFNLTGDVARFLPVALLGSDACPSFQEAYNWHGNASDSSATLSIANLAPSVFYLTLVQNERVPFTSAQISVSLQQSYALPPLPVWWYWASGGIAVIGIISFYILFDAMKQPLGPQKTRV